jgi:hypothetical protein
LIIVAKKVYISRSPIFYILLSVKFATHKGKNLNNCHISLVLVVNYVIMPTYFGNTPLKIRVRAQFPTFLQLIPIFFYNSPLF